MLLVQTMGAYRTVLTHFSQRYPKMPEGLPRDGPAAAGTVVAFDGMRVPLRLLGVLPLLLPAMERTLQREDEVQAPEDEEEAGDEQPDACCCCD